MLKKLRVIAAIVFFIGITLLFVDYTGTARHLTGWMAKVQFLPALLALNVAVVAAILLITLIFGRIYCSVICPLGVMQDISTWLASRRKKARNRFGYHAPLNRLRYVVLALFVVAICLGATSIAAFIAPYSTFGRIASNLFAPVWDGGSELLRNLVEKPGEYLFEVRNPHILSLGVFVTAAASFVIIMALAWRYGRIYCNSICPVGSLLGLVSRFSIFGFNIDTSKCNGCTLCSRRCKAMCIDAKAHCVDMSRCVVCMDCISNCSRHAISYSRRRGHQQAQPVDASRRSFLSVAALTTASMAHAAGSKKVDGGLAIIADKQPPARRVPVVPAGAKSLRNFTDRCVACQLCVTACPNEVLKPSSSVKSFMQPHMTFEEGYCRVECTACSDACPAGAIKPINAGLKTAIKVGTATWIKANCIPVTEGDSCGNCFRHCPSGAITMRPLNPDDPSSVCVPVVDPERCIGCGACEYVCPARPFSAIYVEGIEMHRNI